MKDRYLDIDINAPRLTLEEFENYWCVPADDRGYSPLSDYEEGVCEAEAQYRSECAMFGDAGPGQGLRLAQARAELARIRKVLDRR